MGAKFSLASLCLTCFGLTMVWLQGPSRSQQPAAADDVQTLLITFGHGATRQERWDGSVAVENGRLLRLERWHFSQGDTITGTNTWKCQTRTDELPPYVNIHYVELRPGAIPPVLHHPVGIIVQLAGQDGTKLAFSTAQGNFSFALRQVKDGPFSTMDGRVLVSEVPSAWRLTTAEFEDDEPAIAVLPDGRIAIAWVAYKDRADRIMLRWKTPTGWSEPEQVSGEGDIFRCTTAVDDSGNLWVFWSQRHGHEWFIHARTHRKGVWQPEQLLVKDGTNIFAEAASSRNGPLALVWHGFRGNQSDIFLKVLSDGAWSETIRVSESEANDWEPHVAVNDAGEVFVAWDSYARGNYDIFFRTVRNGKPDNIEQVTCSPRFQAHVRVAVGPQGEPWLAWNESGVNWGKDQGFLVVTPLAVPLHQTRVLNVARRTSRGWEAPVPSISESLPAAMKENAEHPGSFSMGTATWCSSSATGRGKTAGKLGAGWSGRLTLRAMTASAGPSRRTCPIAEVISKNTPALHDFQMAI